MSISSNRFDEKKLPYKQILRMYFTSPFVKMNFPKVTQGRAQNTPNSFPLNSNIFAENVFS